MSAALAGVPSAEAQAREEGALRFDTIDHTALFEMAPDAGVTTCHTCEKPIRASDDHGFAVPGRGLLVFTRGDERRAEEPTLCASCGAAIGMTMLTRWAIEEEEG